jgi:hypothetical protein
MIWGYYGKDEDADEDSILLPKEFVRKNQITATLLNVRGW